MDMNQDKKALDLIETTLEIKQKCLGARHIKTAKSLYLLGNIKLRQNDNTEAIKAIE